MCMRMKELEHGLTTPSFILSPGPNEGSCIISNISFYACGVCNLAPLLGVRCKGEGEGVGLGVWGWGVQ